MPLLPINTLPTSLAGGGPNIVTQGLIGLGLLPPEWGIFSRGGSSVIAFDTVVAFDYRRDWAIADYPLEKGAFESYDKVQTPFSARISMATGGSFSARKRFIRSLQSIENDLKKYDVITPEVTYTNVNIMHVDYRRADAKPGIIVINVYLQEIREIVTESVNVAKQPGGASPVNGGQVQPGEFDAASKAKIEAAFNAPGGISPNA